ncbi:ANTAR domain-containing protein [Halieaceae bacterium IMCC14734]|uniref:ANTAR domain-containing protein n=1 Tax=Candidatus Litorirhabdus singularis TaxID=2518993 RepID=A0ABT3TFY3_9GAMM|nr:ANTAR domain-containing protein [Candidatus Litorirhabdus singularis]MCX2980735.1 ANTAR domain-containing protein [Candidatus Litorirhabdus singularis]
MTNCNPSSPRVMVLDDTGERAAMVEISLAAAGFKVVSVLSSASGLLHQIEQHRPDVIVIDLESPDRDVLESLTIVSHHNPTPIVMFSERDDPDFIAAAIDSGVTVYQNDALDPNLVKTVVQVAMRQFQSFNMLRQELLQTRTELEDRKLVERAKALLAKHRAIDQQNAYSLIRKLSMNSNKTIVDISRTVVATLGDMDS